MALLSFRIENDRSIVLAEAIDVPKIMVIAGPNGVGKSTLLYAIKQGGRTEDPGTRILYQGPHRVMRSTQVQRRWLGGATRWFRELLAGGDVSGFEGLNLGNTARTPANVDEAGSTIKHILGKIENKRQALISGTVDRLRVEGGRFEIAELPDVYEPIRTLTEFILPHLRFESVDFTNEDDVSCYWKRTDARSTRLVDIDQLSSGEKAVIVLFLPLLEDRLQRELTKLEEFGAAVGAELDEPAEEAGVAPEREHRVMLIDEPEQHLHPDLQSKVLSYMRRVSEETPTQFIVTTHSPSILDQAFDTELYVLTEPAEGVEVQNQLRQISTNAERLEALKQLAGSAYFLTTGRVIVCIEGERDADPEKPTDARLLGLLYPRAAAVTLVPTTGKGNVIITVERLRAHVAEGTFKIRVKGLIDADQSNEDRDGIERLPVCMIENFLLDSEALFEFLTHHDLEFFDAAQAVETDLRRIALGMRGKEISLRLRRAIRPKMLRVSGSTLQELRENHARNVAELQDMLPNDDTLQRRVAEATQAVDEIIGVGAELDKFRGKEVLEEFYRAHIATQNIGYNQMCIELARIVSSRGHVAARLDPVFERLIGD